MIKVAGLLGYKSDTIDKIVSQWRTIHLSSWDSTENTIEFWSEVSNYTDSSGSNPFEELCKAALAALSLPHSNAEVERLFSQMSVVKSKLRNRMSLHTLNSILLVRYGLKPAGETCYQHKLPSVVLQQAPQQHTASRPLHLLLLVPAQWQYSWTVKMRRTSLPIYDSSYFGMERVIFLDLAETYSMEAVCAHCNSYLIRIITV